MHREGTSCVDNQPGEFSLGNFGEERLVKCEDKCQGQECEQLQFICDMEMQEEKDQTILYLTIAVIALTVFVMIGFCFL
jgi:hypothetical protein